MTTAYVLIDFENVQPKELGAFGGGGYKVMVFVGPAQPSIPVGLASALQDLGHAGSYIHVSARGPNALDMHIAYYIGQLSASDPGAVFHIISRDRDYDPLILHLKSRQIECTRWKSVADINAAQMPAPAPARAPTPRAAPKAAAAKGPKKTPARTRAKPAAKPAAKATPTPSSTRADEVIANLKKRQDALPASAKALTSTIKSLYRGISDSDVSAIIDDLKSRDVVAIDGNKVTYRLS